MAKYWKKLTLATLSIYGLLSPANLAGQEDLPITILKGINQVGQQLIKKRRSARQTNRIPSKLYTPQATPSKYFLQCKINPSRSNFPNNVCRSDIPVNGADPTLISEAQGFKKIALKNINFLEGLSTSGQESSRPIGLQCLESASQKKLSDIQNLINRLKLESMKIRGQFEDFEQENTNLINEMKKINAQLRGGTDQLDNLSNDFSKEFSPVCQDIFTAEVLSKGNQSGLLGIKNESKFVKQYDLANQAYGNENIWRQDLLDKTQNIKAQINRYGPGVLDDPKKLSVISDQSDPALEKSIATALGKSYLKFKNEYEDINTRTQKTLNYTLPPLDQNFAKSLANFAQSSQLYFKKKLVHECVMGEKYNLSINSQKILKGIKQYNATTRGTNVINYRSQLKNILNQDSFFEDKIAAIRKLDESYGGTIVYTYRDFKEGVVSKPPSEIYRSTLAICERQIAQDNTFARNPSSSPNNLTNINQATRSLSALAKKARTFTSDIANAVFERVANCDGKTLKSGACNNNTLNPNEGGFCIAHAASCANAIRNCHQELDNKITIRTNSLNALAKRWDDSVKNFIVQQKNYLNANLIPPFLMVTEQIRKHLPGATIDYDADTFIKSPLPEKNSEFGIDMLGGGNLEKLKQLPDLIEEKLVGMLKEQKTNLKAEYDKYIQSKRDSIAADLARWKELQNKCEGLESKIANEIEKINRAKMKAFSEQMKSANDFCIKYDSLRQNPAAGCDFLEELYGNSIRASGMINPNVNINLNRFAEHCSQSNNDRNEDTEDDDNISDSRLRNICDNNNNSYESAKSSLEDMAMATVPSEYQDEALKYLQTQRSSPDLISDLSSRQRNSLKKIHKLLHPPAGDHNITQKIVNDLLPKRTQNDIYNMIKDEFPKFGGALSDFKKWKGQSSELTIEDLHKINALPNPKKKTLFTSANFARKILKYIKDHKGLKPNSDDLCAKHMNYALYKAATLCSEKDHPGSDCLKDEFNGTAWEIHSDFSEIEQGLSRLEGLSQAIRGQELGELAQGPCIAPMAGEPRQQKPSLENLLFPDGGGLAPLIKGFGL